MSEMANIRLDGYRGAEVEDVGGGKYSLRFLFFGATCVSFEVTSADLGELVNVVDEFQKQRWEERKRMPLPGGLS